MRAAILAKRGLTRHDCIRLNESRPSRPLTLAHVIRSPAKVGEKEICRDIKLFQHRERRK